MVKKSKSTKRAVSINIILIWLALGLVLLAQIFILLHIKDLTDNQSGVEKRLISDIINRSEANRYSSPVIDVTEGKVYIPEVNAYLPLNNTSLKLRYDYFDMRGVETLYLSHAGVVGNQSEDHTSPDCDKIIAITKNKQEVSNFKYVQSVTPFGPGLKHVYQHNDCNFYTKELSDSIMRVAISLRSY